MPHKRDHIGRSLLYNSVIDCWKVLPPPSAVGAFKTYHISYAAVNDVHGSLFFPHKTPMDLFDRGKEKIGFLSNKKFPEKNRHMIRLMHILTSPQRFEGKKFTALHYTCASQCPAGCVAQPKTFVPKD